MALTNSDIPILTAAVRQALLDSYATKVMAILRDFNADDKVINITDEIPVVPSLYVRMTDISGTVAPNISGSASNGTYTGTVTLATPPVVNNSNVPATGDGYMPLSLGGSGMVNGTGIKTDDGATWSIHFLVYLTTTSGVYLFANNTDAYLRLQIVASAGNIFVNGFQGPPISQNVWTDVLYIGNMSSGTFYINGILWGTAANLAIASSGSSDTTWSFGARNNSGTAGAGMSGFLQEGFIIRAPLAPSQILAIAQLKSAVTSLTVGAKKDITLLSQLLGYGSVNNSNRLAVVNRSKILPFFQASRYERVVSIGIGDSNQNKDAYGYTGGIANAMRLNGGLWGTGLLAAGGSNGFGCAGGGGQGAGLYGTNTGAPSALDALMPVTTQSGNVFYSYTASGNIPDAFLFGPSVLGTPFPGMNENLKIHLTTGVNNGWSSTFTLGARWNQSGPESYFGKVALNPSGAISTSAGSIGTVDQTWNIAAGTFAGTEQIRFDFGNGDVPSGGAGTGPFFASYWQLERTDYHVGFSHHYFTQQGSVGSKYILQALQEMGQTSIVHHFQKAMLYAGPSHFCCIRICEGLNDRNDLTASWNKGSQTFSGPNSNTQQGYYNNVEGIMLQLMNAWTAAGFSLSTLYFWLVPSHPQSIPDDSNLISYRIATDQLSNTYANTASIHLDLIESPADLSARYMYENTDPFLGVNTVQPHKIHAGYNYSAVLELAALLPIGPEVMSDAVNRAPSRSIIT